jgi:Helix-turn-helix domain
VTHTAQDERLAIPLAEASKLLGIDRRTMWRRLKGKDIKAVKIGKRNFIPRVEMDRLLNGGTEPVEETRFRTVLSPSNGAGSFPNLTKSGMSSQNETELVEKWRSQQLTQLERVEAIAQLWIDEENGLIDKANREKAVESMGATPREQIAGLLMAVYKCQEKANALDCASCVRL